MPFGYIRSCILGLVNGLVPSQSDEGAGGCLRWNINGRKWQIAAGLGFRKANMVAHRDGSKRESTYFSSFQTQPKRQCCLMQLQIWVNAIPITDFTIKQ